MVVCLGLFLRLFLLGQIPAGFTPDEASQAYSAFSLLKTGKDEWGIAWPLSSFRSFLDYKAPLQTYLMIPSIAVFGLNEFATRLPSAIFGTLAIIAIFVLAKKLFKNESIALLSALFLSISPWHLQFSRMALEVNLASFLFPLGLYYFLEGLDKPKNYIYTALLWGLSFYTYHAAKVFIPLFSLALIFLYGKRIVKDIRLLVLPLVIFVAILSPLIYGTLFGQAAKRGGDLLITSLSQDQINKLDQQIFYSKLSNVSPILPRLFHNKITFLLSEFVENYVSYFTPSFWFTEGGREITYSVIPGRGLLYFWMMPLMAFGLFRLLKNTKDHKHVIYLIVPWILLAAIPAALTKEGYRPNRAGSYALLWEMVAAFGAYELLQMKFRFHKVITAIFVIVSVFLIGAYFEDYAFGSFVNYPTSMSYGWREAIGYIEKHGQSYKEIHIARGNQAQSFVAFYLSYDPQKFQQYSRDWDSLVQKQKVQYLDQLGDYQLGNFRFSSLNWPEDISTTTLYVSPPSPLLPPQRRTLHTVDIPGGKIIEIFDFNK